jgi:hypothetical protein
LLPDRIRPVILLPEDLPEAAFLDAMGDGRATSPTEIGVSVSDGSVIENADAEPIRVGERRALMSR